MECIVTWYDAAGRIIERLRFIVKDYGDARKYFDSGVRDPRCVRVQINFTTI